ncbi:MAG: sigma-70 family RNA polymerase sigma factor [Sedimentisphaerales bacterium]|nr:sigma-70 family RNA polymerase sigma factor [Sedimentisphaerales bacterium]
MIDWETVVRENQDMVWRLAYRLLGREADAADCFQETFLDALKIARRESVRNWTGLLKRVTIARALDRLRNRKRNSVMTLDESLAPDNRQMLPSHRMEQQELAIQLQDALAQLPQDQAEVFCLKYLNGESYQTIAYITGQNINTVGVNLHRARNKLRVLLDGECEEKY